MLRLYLLGPLRVRLEPGSDSARDLSLPARPAAVLVFLALHRGHFFSRNELVRALWGVEKGSVASLNTALWRLRKAIEGEAGRSGTFICVDPRGGLGVDPAAALATDVEAFRSLIAGPLAKSLEETRPEDLESLRQALELYRGDFLEGCRDDWALMERERYRNDYLNVLGRLAEVAALGGDFGLAITHTRAILEKDPLREDVHRRLMQYYLYTGQRTLALRQFEICRDSLRRELGIPPMRETRELYRVIAQEGPVEATGAGGSSGVPLLSQEQHFLEAQRLLKEARRLLQEAQRHLAAISGS